MRFNSFDKANIIEGINQFDLGPDNPYSPIIKIMNPIAQIRTLFLFLETPQARQAVLDVICRDLPEKTIVNMRKVLHLWIDTTKSSLDDDWLLKYKQLLP